MEYIGQLGDIIVQLKKAGADINDDHITHAENHFDITVDSNLYTEGDDEDEDSEEEV